MQSKIILLALLVASSLATPALAQQFSYGDPLPDAYVHLNLYGGTTETSFRRDCFPGSTGYLRVYLDLVTGDYLEQGFFPTYLTNPGNDPRILPEWMNLPVSFSLFLDEWIKPENLFLQDDGWLRAAGLPPEVQSFAIGDFESSSYIYHTRLRFSPDFSALEIDRGLVAAGAPIPADAIGEYLWGTLLVAAPEDRPRCKRKVAKVFLKQVTKDKQIAQGQPIAFEARIRNTDSKECGVSVFKVKKVSNGRTQQCTFSLSGQNSSALSILPGQASNQLILASFRGEDCRPKGRDVKLTVSASRFLNQDQSLKETASGKL